MCSLRMLDQLGDVLLRTTLTIYQGRLWVNLHFYTSISYQQQFIGIKLPSNAGDVDQDWGMDGGFSLPSPGSCTPSPACDETPAPLPGHHTFSSAHGVELALLLSAQLLTYQPLFSARIAQAPVALSPLCCHPYVVYPHAVYHHAVHPRVVYPHTAHPRAVCPCAVCPSCCLLPCYFSTTLGRFQVPCVCAIPYLDLASQHLA